MVCKLHQKQSFYLTHSLNKTTFLHKIINDFLHFSIFFVQEITLSNDATFVPVSIKIARSALATEKKLNEPCLGSNMKRERGEESKNLWINYFIHMLMTA